jgi:hypothetical protein
MLISCARHFRLYTVYCQCFIVYIALCQVYLADVLRNTAGNSVAAGDAVNTTTRCAIKKFKHFNSFPFLEHPASSSVTSACLEEISVLKFLSALRLPDACALTPTVVLEGADYFAVSPVGRCVSPSSSGASDCLPSRRNIFELLHLLMHLHMHGIFHRDVRRENVLLVAGDAQSSSANARTRLMLIDFGSCTRGRDVSVPYSGAFRQASVAVLRHLAANRAVPYCFSVADELESTVHTIFSWIFPALVAESLEILDPLAAGHAATAATCWERWTSQGLWFEAVQAARLGDYVGVARLLCLVLPGALDESGFDVQAALAAMKKEFDALGAPS